MKRILAFITIIFAAVILVACGDTKEQEPGINEPEIVEPAEPEEIEEDEPEDETTEPEEELITDEKIVLDEELRVKNVSHTVVYDSLEEYTKFKLELFMTGSYDNPLTIKMIKVNGEELDLNIEGLPTRAGEHESGEFILDGHKVKLHRATNYQPLRIKSTRDDAGYLELNLENINTLEIELVFTTAAADYFNEVVLTLAK